MAAKKFSELVVENQGTLKSIWQHGEYLLKLNVLVQEELLDEFKHRVQIGNYKAGRLFLFANNAALATRLRYQVPILLQSLRGLLEFRDLCEIEIRIQVDTLRI